MTKPSASTPDLSRGDTPAGEGVPPRLSRRSRRKRSESGLPQPRRIRPDRMEWADPLTEDEKRALEAGWKFVG